MSESEPAIPQFLKRSQPDEFHEDAEPHYKVAAAAMREVERDLERWASGGHTADDPVGSNGKPLVVGDVAHVEFYSGKRVSVKSGTLVAIGGGMARVRINGSKDPIGDAFPFSRVRTEPVNGGKPLKTKAEKKIAAQHAHALAEFKEAMASGDPRPSAPAARPSDGFEHAQAAAEVVPLPKRVLKGHNGGVSEATVYRHLGAVRRQIEEYREAGVRLRDAWKKAADDGVDKKTLKAVMAEMKLSTDEIIEQTNLLMAYRAMVHLPNAGPLDAPWSPDPQDDQQRMAYARELGTQAGFRGADASSNPYPGEEDPCHVAWEGGWRDAQSKMLLQGMRELDE